MGYKLAEFEDISIHALREEGDVDGCNGHCTSFASFLSTPSARRATASPPWPQSDHGYFYPRPPRGGRRQRIQQAWDDSIISIHALREEGDRVTDDDIIVRHEISIHALREEGDRIPG